MKLEFCVKLWSSNLEYCKVQSSVEQIHLNLGDCNITTKEYFVVKKSLLFLNSMAFMMTFIQRFIHKVCQLVISTNIMNNNSTIMHVQREVL